MGKVSGGGGRTGFQSVGAGGEAVRNMGFGANMNQQQRRAAATSRALRDGATGIRATNDTARQGGAPNQFGRVSRVSVRVTGAGNVRPSAVGVHTFDFGGRNRGYSRSTYRVARARAVQDAARLGEARIRYVGNSGG